MVRLTIGGLEDATGAAASAEAHKFLGIGLIATLLLVLWLIRRLRA